MNNLSNEQFDEINNTIIKKLKAKGKLPQEYKGYVVNRDKTINFNSIKKHNMNWKGDGESFLVKNSLMIRTFNKNSWKKSF